MYTLQSLIYMSYIYMCAFKQRVRDISLSAASAGEVVRAETLALVTIVRWKC